MSEIKKYKKYLNFKANPRYLRRDFMVPLYTGTEPDIVPDASIEQQGMVVDPSRILPKNFTDDMPFVTDENNTEQLELADGGRVEFGLGGKVKDQERLEKLKEIILESNLKPFESLNKDQATTRAGYISAANLDRRTEVKNALNQLIPIEEKFSNYLNNLINNIDNLPFEDVVKAKGMNKYISKVFGIDRMSAKPKINKVYMGPEFKEARDIMRMLSNPSVIETYKNKKMFAGEVIDNISSKKSAQRLRGGNVTDDIVLIAERSKTAGNKNIRFLTKPGTVDASDLVFEWNGKLYGKNVDEYKGKKVNNLTTDLYKLPEFNEYLNSRTKLNDLRKKEVIDPKTKKATTFDQLLRKTYAEGFGRNTSYERTGLELDHLNIKDEPFSNLRPLPTHINQTAGLIKKSYSIIDDKDKALKAIGYFMPENALENSILKFSDRVLNKNIPVSKTYDVGLRAVTGGSKEYLSPESKITTEGLQEGRTGSESLFKGETQVRISSGLRPVSEKERIGKVFNEQKKNTVEYLTDYLNKNPNEVKILKAVGIPCRRSTGGKVDVECLAENVVKEVEKLGTGTDLQKTSVVNKFSSALKRGSGLAEEILGFGKGVVGRTLLPLAALNSALEQWTSGNYREGLRKIGSFVDLTTLVGDPLGFEKMRTKGTIEDVRGKIGKENQASLDRILEFKDKYYQLQDVNTKLERAESATQDPNAAPESYDPDYMNNLKKQQADLNKIINSSKYENFRTDASNVAKAIKDEIFKRNVNAPDTEKYTFETAAQEQFKSIVGEDIYNEIPDVTELIYKNLTAGKKIQKEAIPFEAPEIQAPDDSMIRQEFKEGGGPKISRRGLLGLLTGAAAAPELIKAFKGKKTAQTAKVASKIKIEPAEGMYPWFPKLVEKVKEMGKPFEEKQLIMEPSYKNSPRPFTSRPPTGEEKLTRHVDGDTTFILREYPDGRLAVDIDSPRNQQSFGQPVSLYYRPKMEIQNYKGEKKIEPPEFKVLEPEPKPFVSGPDDVDITFTEIPKNPKRDIVFGDIEAAERFATGDIKNRKIIPIKQSLRNEMEEDPSTFIMRQSGELGSKAQPEEIIKLPEEFATGGRVGFGDGSKDPNRLIPIDPLLQDQSPTDPGKRDVLKLGIASAGILGLGKLGLLKLGSSVKPSIFAEAVKGTTAPSWMDGLMTKILTEGTEIKMPKESSIIKKEVKFKNPETGDVQTATLTIDSKEDRMFIEYDSPTNVANQPVVLELSRERKVVPNPGGESNWFAPDKTKGYNFYATETGPRVVDYDGNIEFDAEDTAFKIIDLKSDISGLKSYATGGKGIDKKIAKQKRAATADIEKNPEEYVPDWEPEIYD